MYKILIADDESLIRNSIVDLLSPFSYKFEKIITAEDGLEALFKINQFAPQIVIFDINMPFLNGLEAVKKIRQHNDDIIIIIVSGYNKFEYAQQAIKNRVFSYMLKPINEEEFKEVITSAILSLSKKNSKSITEESIDSVDNEIIKYINDNFNNLSLSMISVCSYFHISNSSLSRLLKKETDMSFTDYLTKIRMEKAIALLEYKSNLNIKEISDKVGYRNQHYFSRAFKNYTGLSPKKYKESL